MDYLQRLIFLLSAKSKKSMIIYKHIVDELMSEYDVVIITDDQNNKYYRQGINVIIVKDLSLLCLENTFKDLSPFIMLACGWLGIIHKKILDIPNNIYINFHSSYLPDYKGLSVFKHIWANNEKYIGATSHYLTEKIDQGNIILTRCVK